MTKETVDLVDIARDASQNAYAPYSCFKVGCAVLTANGKVYKGANVENSAFGSTICAERVALCSAISAGERSIVEIAVYNSDTTPNPCGACLQVISELAPDATVTVASDNERKSFAPGELLPNAFCESTRLKKQR